MAKKEGKARQEMVEITNGSETRLVTAAVANDTKTLSQHGWYIAGTKKATKPTGDKARSEEEDLLK